MQLSHTNKPKRAIAFEYVKALKRGEQLPQASIDALLNYFAPPVPKTAKTAEQWVAKACSTDSSRPSLYGLQVVDGVLYGCDTHRLHWAPTNLPDGTYCPKTLAAIEYARPPQFWHVMPDPAKLQPVAAADMTAHVRDDSDGKAKFDRYVQAPDLAAVVEHYFIDATNGTPASVELRADDTVLYGEGPFGKFVVMGLRL